MKESLSFEKAIKQLEDAVSGLENGDLSLDEALKTFEQAIGLVRYCQNELETAKQKVSLLTEQSDGSVKPLSFDSAEED